MFLLFSFVSKEIYRQALLSASEFLRHEMISWRVLVIFATKGKFVKLGKCFVAFCRLLIQMPRLGPLLMSSHVDPQKCLAISVALLANSCFYLKQFISIKSKMFPTQNIGKNTILEKLCSFQVKLEVGDVDILVNNAGIVTGKPFLSCRDEAMIKTMEVNAFAHFWVKRQSFSGSRVKKHWCTVPSCGNFSKVFEKTWRCDASERYE